MFNQGTWSYQVLVGVGFLNFLIGCVSLAFLHCALSNVSSNCLPEKMQSHIVPFGFWPCHLHLAFPQCVFTNVFINVLPERVHNHIGCICFVCLLCVFPNVSSNHLPEKGKFTLVAFACIRLHKWLHIHIGCNCITFLHHAFQMSPQIDDAKSHWLHLFDFSPLCICKHLPDKNQSHICLAFPHGAFANGLKYLDADNSF